MNLYRFLFFTFLIFISKEILVLNEELLILFSFVCFNLLWLKYLSSFIYDELNQRKSKLLYEFNAQYILEKNILTSLIKYNNKKTHILQEVKDLSFCILSEIIKIELVHYLILYHKLHIDIDYKLNKLSNINSKSILYSLLFKKFNSFLNQHFFAGKDSFSENCIFFHSLLSSKFVFLKHKSTLKTKYNKST